MNDDNVDTELELSRLLLRAAQNECKNATIAMSEGSTAGKRFAMHHCWQLLGINKVAQDLYEAHMIDGSYYEMIVETLDYVISLDIPDLEALVEEQK